MILRDRQKLFVERSVRALLERRNTLGVAPTGAGKTIMLAAVAGRLLDSNGSKACILAHRDEITGQNVAKFMKVNPGMPVSVVDAAGKDWGGKAVFAMIQTLSRERNLAAIPPLELLVIDEAHHARAESYRRVIEAARARNPRVMIYGVTATPNRGDGKGLRAIFDNVSDQITLSEMIAEGQLVRPRTFVIDIGVQDELRRVRRLADEFDMDQVASIMDHRPITAEILRHWREKAGVRRTVVFCSTVAHAEHVAQAFQEAGVAAELVTGETPDAERAAIFGRLDRGGTQVLVNVAVATEGWDCPPISCVVLLRPCSYKSVMIQMIGRGLRKVDPERYPGVVKTDCVVLDFGASALLHGALEQRIILEGREKDEPGETPCKTCPECGAAVPTRALECPMCGHEFAPPEKPELPELERFEMTEVDLLRNSPFQWCPVASDDSIVMATGFEAWGGIVSRGGRWYAVGGAKNAPAKVLQVGERLACLASADDWLRENETEDAAHKSRRWLRQPVTDKQLRYLPPERRGGELTRYEASCVLAHAFNRWRIDRAIRSAEGGRP